MGKLGLLVIPPEQQPLFGLSQSEVAHPKIDFSLELNFPGIGLPREQAQVFRVSTSFPHEREIRTRGSEHSQAVGIT